MKNIAVLYGQELIDIVIQELGDASRLMEVAILNNVSPTGGINPGSYILIPDYDPTKKDIVKVFTGGIKPASITGVNVSGFWNFDPVLSDTSLVLKTDQNKVKVEASQELIDIVIQELGDASRLMEVAILNNVSPTGALSIGSYILVPEADPTKRDIVKVFSNGNKPASFTGITPDAFWNFEPILTLNIPNIQSTQKRVRVEASQELIDIVIQELGDPSRLIEVALLNNISPTENLESGSYVVVPSYDNNKKDIVRVFANPMNKPASGMANNQNSTIGLDGIDYWAVYIDFVVS
jgi:hypothetical protein